jgi:hypothetical protein
MEAPLWSEGASAWPHERDALAFVKSRLPNYEPYRAWTNVQFIAEDGSLNEIDLLAVTPRGVLLVEIKSFPGKLFGDGQRWRNVRPNGAEKSLDHPVLLANTKSKVRVDPILDRAQPRLLQPGCLCFEAHADLHVGERLAPPEGQPMA